MKIASLSLALTLTLVSPTLASPERPLTEEQRIVHVLNRLGFGSRPGDVERIKTLGLKTYIQQQLYPETVKDEVVEAKAAGLTGLALTPRQLDRLEQASRQKSSRGDAAEAKRQVSQAAQQVVANKLMRAIESEKQLQEVLVDFWSNHFNIDAAKVRTAKIIDEQQVIRPHVLGKFSELLSASAHSAAMMLYLDNDQSTVVMREQGRGKKKKKGGLNENYARELLELHTLGVDGGYTQRDVTEMARCLTGWGVKRGKYSSEFEFHDALHDKDPKSVLGLQIPAGGGQDDAQTVLDLLARHPATMRFISTKLCRRFVSDEPPASLVNKCIATWKQTDGDIREILATITSSPEFFSAAAYKSKIKSPFEFVVSSARALGASYTVHESAKAAGEGFNKKAPSGKETLLSGQLNLLGQPLFRYTFPTGYPEDSRKWVSSGALIGRINYALRLTEGRLDDLTLPPLSPEKPDVLALRLLGQPLSAATRATLQKQATTEKKALALLLGAPEFQRR
jgi:uncharacterized protein (DUF1800 family)